ncbi:MAG: hypothetical protein ACI3YM_09260 [Prevotella sp.]
MEQIKMDDWSNRGLVPRRTREKKVKRTKKEKRTKEKEDKKEEQEKSQ